MQAGSHVLHHHMLRMLDTIKIPFRFKCTAVLRHVIPGLCECLSQEVLMCTLCAKQILYLPYVGVQYNQTIPEKSW